MKYRNGLFVIACLIILIGITSARDFSADHGLPLQVSSRIMTANGLRLSLEIAEPEWKTVGTANDQVSLIDYKLMCGFLEKEGLPSVPVTSRNFRLPPGKTATLEILDAQYETFTDIDYAAYLGGTTPEELGRTQSTKDSWYPGNLAELTEPSHYHDFRVANLVTYPVQVNTARKEVRVYNRIDVDIHFENDPSADLSDQFPTAISRTFLPWYRQFLDWDETELNEYALYRGGVQVVLPDNDELWEVFDPWIEWKLQKGWELEFLTNNDVNNWSAGNIRGELRDRYEEQKFDYVVIVGDLNGDFATPSGTNGADYYYQLMDNDDIYQDVIVGRISVQDAEELEIYVNKVLSYERDPYMEETDWYLQGACYAIYDYHPIDGTAVCEYIRSELFNIGYTNVFYDSSPTGPEPVRGNILEHVNEGITYFHSSGAISDGITRTQAHELTNNYMPFVSMQLTEGTGVWHNQTEAISEALMRAGTVDTPTGAIGAFGFTTNSTDWKYEDGLSTGGAYAAIHLRLPELGQMVWGGQAFIWNAFHPDWATGGYTFQNFANQFNLMGDPLVWLWTAIPAEMNVEADDTIPIGRNSYSVEVTDENDNPVENAWVTLYKVDDNENVIFRGETGADGSVLLDAPFRYSGDAILTVTAQNHQPVQVEVEVREPNARIGYVEVEVIDDGNNGTEGNNNSIPEAGETVGLRITTRNFGNNQQTNISITAACEDDWIENIDGEAACEALNPDAEETCEGLILVEIDPQAQNDWIFHLELEFESDQGTWTDDYPLKVQAPSYLFVQVTGSEELEPGDDAEITIEIVNIGGGDASASEGHLTILHSYGGTVEPDAEFEAMEIGESASASFEIRSHLSSIPGFVASSMLVITTEDQQIDTIWFSIPLGTRSESEPCGPDRYGYWAFDNRDSEYDIAPVYGWIEINPEIENHDLEGTLLIEDVRVDYGEAPAIPLPFEVQYYGETFDTITINNNGWAAFGDQSQFFGAIFHFPIPGPFGPYNMIAPFWDERYLQGESGIFTSYDEENDRLIIEWYESLGRTSTNSYGQACTFEIVIYDLAGDHVTRTGDNEILFQYKDREMNPHSGYSRHMPWWTTGIKDGTQTDGLQYYYWLMNSPGAVEEYGDFNDSLAILFTTNVELILGSIEGTVTNSVTEEPIEGVLISADDNYYQTYTDDNGYYMLEGIYVGEHTLSYQNECYNEMVLTGLIVAEDETTMVNTSLLFPELSLDPDEIDHELSLNTQETIEIVLANPGNGTLEYEADIYLDDPREHPDQTDEAWNNLYAFDLDPVESRYFGIAFVNREYYVSGSNNLDPTGPNKIYKYDNLGRELVTTFDQPVTEEERTATGMRGIAWDGDYLYGVDDEVIYQMEIFPDSITLVDSWEAPVPSAHFLEYDPGSDLFWMGNYDSDIYGINRDGEVIQRYERELIPRGAAWNPFDEFGRNLYLFTQWSSRSEINVVRMNPLNGENDIVYTIPYPAGRWALAGVDFSNTWNPLVNAFSALINQTEESYVQVWYLSDNETFFSINNPGGVLDAGEENIIEFMFNSTGLPFGSYSFYVGFDNNACEDENNYISITMTLPDTTDEITDPDIEQPLEWSFDGAYPNPFNQILTVRFALKETAIVRMKIYNLLGQEVAELANLPMTAGRYAVPFDGSGLSSGMYFLQFNAGPLHETRKIVLLK
ncbi:MAG: C25 family cysteine peptidase [Candidatus Electryonea clarkiae]|nr:C25 family cysteine peptidase [Candidatus Electryonea clarkiae]MDP8285658.1 C25 family cysteine peptidase [Candidatus Electryonea clarkiae]